MNKTFVMMGIALLLAACQITVQQPTEQQPNTINVNGNAQFKAAPDEATVMLRVETNGTTAKEAQDKNSAAMTAVQRALKKAGIAENEMETINYNLYPNVYWDHELQRQVEAGYKVSHTLRFKTKDLERAGEFIQAGVDAGATNVDSVSFALSSASERDAKNEALRQATQDARQKADALADGLDLKITRVVSVSINEYNVMPFYRGGMAYAAEAMMEKAPEPPIAPQEIDVMANVQVVFEIA
jgi:hypothetical protein